MGTKPETGRQRDEPPNSIRAERANPSRPIDSSKIRPVGQSSRYFKARPAEIGVRSSKTPIRRHRVDKHATINPQYLRPFNNLKGPKPFGQSVIALFHSRTKSSSTIGVSHSLETIQENMIRKRSFKGSIIPNGSKIRPIVDKTIRLVKEGETKSRFFKLIVSSDIFHNKPSKPESSPVEPSGIIPLEHILCISKPEAENACLASITHCRRSSILFEPIRRSSIYVTPENGDIFGVQDKWQFVGRLFSNRPYKNT
ncbi:hypothetical protein DERF_010444 [Dermatophagoides farinae]|uniref:Uncharacterized protein n=1 Tax=Dermatophagoides farinae TaxID=6954 RepID=A0A922HVX4_DERFA|nr:hypothetical protein DERF_010444 [Dermatophagoides farinae]